MRKPPLIMIVDDIPSNFQVLGPILSEAGYNLVVARDGRQALEKFPVVRPDLVLMDVMMPGMNGLEACQRLKADPDSRDVPIILLSALSEREHVMEGFAAGAVDYVTKPFNHGELLARVRTQLELKDNRDAIAARDYSIRQMLHVLSHDLASPVNNAKAMIDFARTNPRNFGDCLDIAAESLENASKLIGVLKTIREIEEGKLKLELRPVDVKYALDLCLAALEDKRREKKLTVNLDVPAGLRILSDVTTLINSVLNDIVSNAFKFSPPGAVVDIAGESLDGRVELRVVDHGAGMPPAILDHLFDLGAATRRPGTGGEEGVGYGMSLVRKLVEAYGGDILVESREKTGDEPDPGTSVRLIFQAAPDEE